ncbi:UDP-glucose--hexose-1-phosphate uridylyltransferase [Lacticaseibacillus brantae]|uniref:Galactose-1-phosphate uridylyltransferase n=1 Tax=Lacticaseibacillus brantae DSM 23927 TaxID=1423727 RepID=A0A0R2B1U9_9LACO|nr:UDP-glucose--hexose-1-phosphate uridylyltransferase [Lacticaseibacillus brantae]KRM72738.1 UDP-glucose--hexose-1-phosphate uridylyltransferase [Lacticaseibacillus brantae DSM 23927]
MQAIDDFIAFILDNNDAYTAMDQVYLKNRLFAQIGETHQQAAGETPLDTLDALVQTALQNQMIPETAPAIEQLQADLMNLVTPTPSAVNSGFWTRYQTSPQTATDYFYHLSERNNYIQTRALAKNTAFNAHTEYGDLEITINLAKPEKDPKAIALAAAAPSASYPLCQLCIENEGYEGRDNYPARANHRIVRLSLAGHTWGFQYSPYAYFNEHAIFLDSIHQPMRINRQTFSNLFDLVTLFPHYFVGSNADLPIVGGSMLAHDHYQGGRHTFAMAKAPIEQTFAMTDFPDVHAGVVKWPMSVIRLTAADKQRLGEAAWHIQHVWQQYSDEAVDVRAFTDQTPHHTITPIVRRVADDYQIDLVLRDNQTSDQYPDGIFHPHQDVQHIKKENIGLIEVMGLAILPARLQTELQEVEKFLLNQPNQMAAIHRPWAESLRNGTFTADSVHEYVQQAVGAVFAKVLEDAGVFKRIDAGQAAFARFIAQL